MTAPSRGTPVVAAPRRALFEAAEAAVAEARTGLRRPPPAARPVHRAQTPTLLTGLVLFAVGVYILAAHPGWLVTPDPAVESAELREASLRLTLVREAHRVRQFQAAAGRVPASLEEIGSPVGGLRYHAAGNGAFTLSLQQDGHDLMYRSRDSAAVFLGASVRTVLARKGEPAGR